MAEEAGLLAAVDTRLNDDLIQEGLAREVVRRVQATPAVTPTSTSRIVFTSSMRRRKRWLVPLFVLPTTSRTRRWP
ncbi:MAG: hypothetical protein HND48_05225 [Chloroflexi bacterium]|nr:hypothetical protein [Chloroflexota bacterium]